MTAVQPASRVRSLLAAAKTLPKSAFGVGGLALIVAITGLNISNFVFHLVVSRLVGPAKYGELSALLNVVVVLAIPLGALQAAVAQVVAQRDDPSAPIGIRRITLWATLAGLAGAGVWAALVAPVDSVLHLPSAAPALCLTVWIVLTVLYSVFQGVLMGQRRFRPVAVSQLVGEGLIRLAVAVILVAAGFGVLGALLATPISALAGVLILGFACRKDLRHPGHLHLTGGDAFRSVAGLGGATLLTSMDAWLARHFLVATHAGWFAAASTAGRIALFLPGAITTVVFPSLAAARGRGPEARHALKRALVSVGGVSLASALVLALLPHLIVSILFGRSFDPAAQVLPIIGVADAGIAIVSLLIYFFLTCRSRWSLGAWGSCALAVVLGALFHGSNRALAFDMLATNLLTAVVLLVVAWCRLSARHLAPSVPDDPILAAVDELNPLGAP